MNEYELIVVLKSGDYLGRAIDAVEEIPEILSTDRFGSLRSTFKVTVSEQNYSFVIPRISMLPYVASVNVVGNVEDQALENLETEISLEDHSRTMKSVLYFSFLDKAALKLWNRANRPRTQQFSRERNRGGAGIYVAVLDSGVRSDHPEFVGDQSRVIQVHDPIGGTVTNGHGTACAGIIAGSENGFLPDATVLALRGTANNGSGSTSDIVSCLGQLKSYLQNNNIAGNNHVLLNMSFSEKGENISNNFAAAITELQDLGVYCFAAAGNASTNYSEGSYNSYPAEGLDYGAIGSLSIDGRVSLFSNTGTNVRVFAFGDRTIIPAMELPTGVIPNNSSAYGEARGTSFSCPTACGAFGTWVMDKEPATNKAEADAYMQQWEGFCFDIAETTNNPEGIKFVSPATSVLMARGASAEWITRVQAKQHGVITRYGEPTSTTALADSNKVVQWTGAHLVDNAAVMNDYPRIAVFY